VLLDVVGTFVTPALTYSTWRVGGALLIGMQVLRRSWPHAALYVVVPPVALVVVNLFAQPGLLAATVTVALASLLNLLVKGAVAAYYLRVVGPVAPDGAQKPPAYSLRGGATTARRGGRTTGRRDVPGVRPTASGCIHRSVGTRRSCRRFELVFEHGSDGDRQRSAPGGDR
jgi:hypothetical protein